MELSRGTFFPLKIRRGDGDSTEFQENGPWPNTKIEEFDDSMHWTEWNSVEVHFFSTEIRYVRLISGSGGVEMVLTTADLWLHPKAVAEFLDLPIREDEEVQDV